MRSLTLMIVALCLVLALPDLTIAQAPTEMKSTPKTSQAPTQAPATVRQGGKTWTRAADGKTLWRYPEAGEVADSLLMPDGSIVPMGRPTGVGLGGGVSNVGGVPYFTGGSCAGGNCGAGGYPSRGFRRR